VRLILDEEQAALAGADDVEVAIPVDVYDRNLHATTQSAAVVDNVPDPFDAATTERVVAAISLRRSRDRLLPDKLFGDPAWDALLEVYAAEASGEFIGLPELTARLGVAESQARRWTDILTKVGLLVEAEGALAISPEGRRKIEKIFA